MKRLIVFLLLTLFGCQKNTDLGENYPRIIGTWTNNSDATVQFNDNGRVSLRYGTERGLKFRIQSVEEFPMDDGTWVIRFKGKPSSDDFIEVKLLQTEGKAKFLRPHISDTLTKI